MRGSPTPGGWPWLLRTAPQCGPSVREGSLRASRSRSVLPPAAPARIRFADPSSPPVPLPMIRRSDFDPSVPDSTGSVPRSPALSGRSALPTPHPAQPQPPVHPFLPPFSVVSPTPAPSLEPHPCSLLLSQLVCSVSLPCMPHSFVYSFICLTFTEGTRHAKHWSRHWRKGKERSLCPQRIYLPAFCLRGWGGGTGC